VSPAPANNDSANDDAAEEAPAKKAPPTPPSNLPKWAQEKVAPPPPADHPDAALELADLGKDYGDGMGLNAIDLIIEPGELIMLVGPNGAGKSTMLGLCAGMLEPTNGHAYVKGNHIGSIEARAATSYLPDAPVLYEDLSVNEHIEYIARLHRTHEWEDYADDLLDMFNLTERADDLPSTFSRGLKQKTSLILGLVRPFGLLLVDEPFVGLDSPGQETLVEVLADIAEQGAAVLVSTHQLDLAPRATRCVGLRDGELSYDGPATPEKIRSLVGG